MLTKALTLLGLAAITTVSAQPMSAASYYTPMNATVPGSNTTQMAGDLMTLNYALQLEFLEAAYYTQGQSHFTNANFTAAGMPQGTYTYFNLIRDSENAHVSFINSTIVALGGTPVMPCVYNFTTAYKNATTYVQYAQVFENVGVSAYDGAIATISNPLITQAAATIATVEARHAAFLNLLVGSVPFPNNVDAVYNATYVGQLVTPFLTSCPQSFMVPGPTAVTAQ